MLRQRSLTVVVLLLVAGLLGQPAGPAEASTPTVRVVPSDLPEGGPLTVASLDRAHQLLVRPGRAPVSLASLGGAVSEVHQARGGYLADVTVARSGRRVVSRQAFVGADGSRRIVGSSHQFSVAMVASDGRTFIGERSQRTRKRNTLTLKRFRISDGRPVGKALNRRYSFGALDGYHVLAVTPHAVVLASWHPSGRRIEARTESWNTRTGRVRVLARHRVVGRDVERLPDVQAASGMERAASTVSGRHQIMRSTRTGKGRWKTRRYEAVAQFSPNGKRVLTVADTSYLDFDQMVSQIAVRSARTGRIVARFSGYLGSAVTWETSDSFVAGAYSDVVLDDLGVHGEGWARVRCTVSTSSCERLPADTGVLVIARSR